MTFLLGRQAMFGHEPPTYFRSMTATRRPCPAKVQAATVPPVPLPRITTSYSSMLACRGARVEGAFSVTLIGVPFSNGFQRKSAHGDRELVSGSWKIQ